MNRSRMREPIIGTGRGVERTAKWIERRRSRKFSATSDAVFKESMCPFVVHFGGGTCINGQKGSALGGRDGARVLGRQISARGDGTHKLVGIHKREHDALTKECLAEKDEGIVEKFVVRGGGAENLDGLVINVMNALDNALLVSPNGMHEDGVGRHVRASGFRQSLPDLESGI